jgi:hypothetical protein
MRVITPTVAVKNFSVAFVTVSGDTAQHYFEIKYTTEGNADFLC